MAPTSNELNGVVQGSAVQARSIEGGVHFSITQLPPVRITVPAQLPLAPAYFTGRSAELAGLQRATAEYDPVRRLAVVVVTGPGGSGKTALLTHWLHRTSGRYEGGALYADLHGHTLTAAASPGDVLTGFLSALGIPPDQIPVELEDQAKLYRSLTSGRRVLMLLDDAATAAQVRSLLPGPGPVPGPPSLVAVTSRRRIAGLAIEGARFLELGPLDDQAGTELLSRMLGSERVAAEAEAVRSVVRLCGGLPLAVCAVGAQLVSHTRWPLGRMVARLTSEKDRLAAFTVTREISVQAAFDVSYHSLPPDTAYLYRLLAFMPGPDFDPPLAAATAGLPPDEAARLLDALSAASLLMETGEQRFRFHDLVRLHARDRALAESAGERSAIVARAIGWYLAMAVAADIVIIPGRWHINPAYEAARAAPPSFADPPAALRWIEAELPCLIAAVRTAHDEGMHEQAWQLCEALWGLFAYRKYFRYWIQVHLLGIASAQACGNQPAQARLRVQLGLAYLNLGQPDQAREEFARSLALAREGQHPVGEASALEHLGLTELSRDHPEDAMGLFREARDVYSRIGVARGVMGATRHIGEAHRDAGRHELAVRYLLDARQLAAVLPDPYNEARCLTSLGRAYLIAGQPGPAADALGEALALMERLDGRYEQARIHVMLADALLHLDRPGPARAHLTDALALYSASSAPEAETVRRRLGELGLRT